MKKHLKSYYVDMFRRAVFQGHFNRDRQTAQICDRQRGTVVIAPAYKTEDPGFESCQGVNVLSFYIHYSAAVKTLHCHCVKLWKINASKNWNLKKCTNVYISLSCAQAMAWPKSTFWLIRLFHGLPWPWNENGLCWTLPLLHLSQCNTAFLYDGV
jgi:hypothetical protein